MIPLLPLLVLILLSALGAVWMARPVHAALCMALSLALIAVLYLVLDAHFIGLVQFMVYVGAVAVLIVFALLMTRPGDETREIQRRPGAWLTGLACALPVTLVIGFSSWVGAPIQKALWDAQISIQDLGKVLFTTYAPAVLVVALVLTAVLIGAALFAREPQP